MKSFLLTFSLAISTVLYAGDTFARMEMETFTAKIEKICLLGDGVAMSVTVDLPDGVFKGRVLGRGVADLSLGKEVRLAGEKNPDSTGYGEFCLKDQECKESAAKLRLPTQEEMKDPSALGSLIIPSSGAGSMEIEYFVTPVQVKPVAHCHYSPG